MKFFTGILLIFFVFLAPLNVQATSYAMPTFEDAYASADFILYGTILSVTNPYEGATYEACGNKVYAQRGKIQIKKHWKMELDEEENVLSPGTHLVNPDMGACDVSFPLGEGKEIIIFGNLDEEGRLTTYGGSLNVYEDSTYFSDAMDFLNKKTNAVAAPPAVDDAAPAPVADGPLVIQDESAGELTDTEDETQADISNGESESQMENEEIPVTGVLTDSTEQDQETVIPTTTTAPAPSRGIVEQIVDFIRGLFGFK